MPRKTLTSRERKARASRANGAKSRGPVTEEGKRRSSRNSTKHGLRGTSTSCVLLPGEDAEKFNELIASLFASVKPRDSSESVLTLLAASAYWRLIRAEGMDSALQMLKGAELDSQLAQSFGALPADFRNAACFHALLKDDRSFRNFTLYRNACTLQADRAFRQIERLRKLGVKFPSARVSPPGLFRSRIPLRSIRYGYPNYERPWRRTTGSQSNALRHESGTANAPARRRLRRH